MNTIREKMTMKKLILILATAVVCAGAALPLHAQDGDALIEAVMYQEIDTVRHLVQEGADIDYQEAQNETTALMLACNYGLLEIAEFLVEQGADVNLRNKQGHTALIAAAGRSRELVKLLLDHGADVGAGTALGTTAFTASVVGAIGGRVSTDVAEILLKAGADVNESASSGEAKGYTCLMMAARSGKPDLVRFLTDNGADPNLRAADGSTALSLARNSEDEESVRILTDAGAVE